MEGLADSKIRKYEKEEYLSVVRFNSKWQDILHVFKYSRYVYPASRVSTCTCTCIYI